MSLFLQKFEKEVIYFQLEVLLERGSLCWKTVSHSCPAVTTSVSLRDQSLSNITYSREDTQLEAQMIEMCLDTHGMVWSVCHNTN